VLVVKNQRTLALQWALGGSPVGAKEQQGDHKTPEGHYITRPPKRTLASKAFKPGALKTIKTYPGRRL